MESGLTADGDPPRKVYGKVARQGVAWSFVREGVVALIAAPEHLILARLLTPFDFGVAAAAAFCMALATRLTNLGFNQALVRIKELRPEHCAAVFVVSLLLGVMAFTVLASTAGLIATFFREPEVARMLRVAALIFLIVPFGTVPSALMTRQMRFERTAVTEWLSTLGRALSALAFAWAGYGYWSLVYGRLVEAGVATISRLLYGTWYPSIRFSKAALQELLSFATGVFFKRLLDYSAKNLDNLVVGRMMGVVALGFYDRAFLAMDRILARINTGGPMVSFRVFALIQDQPERFRKAYLKVIMGASLVTYPVLFGLATIAPDLIPVLYGEQWYPVVAPLQILCVAGTLKVMNEYASTAVQALGKIWNQVWRQGVYAGLIVVGVAAFSRWGLPGAAVGVLIPTIAMYLLMQRLVTQVASLPALTVAAWQLPGLLCGIGVGGAVLATGSLLGTYTPSTPQWQRLVAEIALGLLAGIAFIKFNRFEEVRKMIRDVSDDLPPSLRTIVKAIL